MRIEGVVLEDHRDVAVLCRYIVYQLVADKYISFGYLLEAGYHPQCRGLSASGRAYKYHKFLVLDTERHIRDSFYVTGIDL